MAPNDRAREKRAYDPVLVTRFPSRLGEAKRVIIVLGVIQFMKVMLLVTRSDVQSDERIAQVREQP